MLWVCLEGLTATVHVWWGCAVRQVQLSKEGAPQAILSNRTAWLYHSGLACWLCLADSAFASSPFTSLLPLNPSLQGTQPPSPPLLFLLPCRASHCCMLGLFTVCLYTVGYRLSGYVSVLVSQDVDGGSECCMYGVSGWGMCSNEQLRFR